MASLSGQTALVTGASGGIGRATAVALGALGARVAVHYFSRQEDAAETCRLVEAAGATAQAFRADVSAYAPAQALVAEVEAGLGPIDVLVNNAGDLMERRTLAEMTEARWRQVIDLNLGSVFFVSQAVTRGMAQRGRGVVVNLSSLAAHNGGGPGSFAYAAAKGGVISLTKGMAKELAPLGVRVNCVSPGLIDNTAFHARYTARAAFDTMARGIPIGRAGEPAEVASVIAFLATDASAYLVGETIEVNGGSFMK